MTNVAEIIFQYLMSTKFKEILENLQKAIKKEDLISIKDIFENISESFKPNYCIKIILRTPLGEEIITYGTIVSDIKVEYPISDKAFLQLIIAPSYKQLKSVSIIFLGLAHAGKSSISYSIQEGYHIPTTPTIGVSSYAFEYRNLQILGVDIGGHETFHNLWTSPKWEHSKVIVYVIDAADESNFSNSITAFRTLILQSDLYKKIPIILVANKQDLPTAKTPEEISTIFQTEQFLNDRKWQMVGTSAKDGTGLAELMEVIYSICHGS
jgi:small GTP-binding protein